MKQIPGGLHPCDDSRNPVDNMGIGRNGSEKVTNQTIKNASEMPSADFDM